MLLNLHDPLSVPVSGVVPNRPTAFDSRLNLDLSSLKMVRVSSHRGLYLVTCSELLCPLVRAFIATDDKCRPVPPVCLLTLLKELSTGRAIFSFSAFCLFHHTKRVAHALLFWAAFLSFPTHGVRPSRASFVIHVHLRRLLSCRGGTFVYGAILLFGSFRSHVCDSYESGSRCCFTRVTKCLVVFGHRSANSAS